MRVLHVVPALAPRYGGPSRTVVGLCAATRRLGVDAEIWATDADGPGRRLPVPLDVRHDWNGVPVRFFRRRFPERYKPAPAMARRLRREVDAFDLVLAHACFSWAPEAAARAARRRRVPVAWVPHGMLTPWALHGRPLKQAYYASVLRPLLASAAGILCTSEGERAEMRRLRLRAPCAVIPWGIEPQPWLEAPRRPLVARQRLGIGAERPLVVSAGRLHPKKGVADVLLPALARLGTPVTAVIAGSADAHEPGHERLLRRALRHLPATVDARMPGRLDGPALVELMDAGDVFVLASHGENFGRAVVEAMARGCAIVVSDRVQIARELERRGCALVVPPQPEAVAGALRRLLADRPLARSLGQRARAMAMAEFTWDRAARRATEFYRELLGPQRSR